MAHALSLEQEGLAAAKLVFCLPAVVDVREQDIPANNPTLRIAQRVPA
jgi:hypothetical protein